MRFLKDTLLVLVSLALSVVVAEGVVRYIDGYPILLTPLGQREAGLGRQGLASRRRRT